MKTKQILFSLCLFFVLTAKAQYTPTLGLLASYPFSGNANDDSGNGHQGTVYGATLTTDRFNNPNSAYSFDGVNDYISVPDNITNFRPQVFTISAWGLSYTFPSFLSYIFSKNVLGVTNAESIGMAYNGQSPSQWFGLVGTTATYGPALLYSSNIIIGTWYNIVYEYDNINNIQKMFINGVPTLSSTINTSIVYDSNIWTIGSQYEFGTLSYFWNGKIDDIGIWDRILTDNEISSIYQGCQTPTLVVSPSQTVNVSDLVQISVASTSSLLSYQWQINTGAGFSNLNNNSIYSGVTTSVLAVVPDASQANSNLYYRCIVSSSCGTYTSVITWLTVNGVTGVNELSQQQKWSIYPNPTNKFFNVQISSEMIGKHYKLTDINGKIVYSEKITSDDFHINVEEFQEGIYVLSVDGLSDKKVIRIN